MVPLAYDRREIAHILLPKFPQMEGKTSQEWAAFLNEMTGLAIDHDMPNASAFDAWRQALAAQGHADVWPFTDYDVIEMKLAGIEMAKAEKARVEAIERAKKE